MLQAQIIEGNAPDFPVCHRSASSYNRGCRCNDCRSAHNVRAKERRANVKAGIRAPLSHVDPGPTREALQWLRDAGMAWTTISGVTGVDKQTLYQTLNREKIVAYSTEQAVVAAVARVKAHPKLLTRDALLLDASWPRWQYQALLARGWTQDMIEAEAGIGVPCKPKVQRRTVDAYNRVFDQWHDKWGPLRRTAVLAWRKGWLPADCYLWEEGDTRPIPGSLHPDLVIEAATFTPGVPKSRSREVLDAMAKIGQWPDALCARKAHRSWTRQIGLPDEDYDDLPNPSTLGRPKMWCNHEHGVPRIWKAQSDQTLA